jgi:DNA invertase Pin-like site-specific DNA recombinase
MDTLHIYTRVSSSAQEEDGTSLDTQKELGIKKAKELGMKAKVWNEGGQSSKGDDLLNRPELTQILTRIESGEIKHLWVFNTDRLSRNETTWSLIRLKLLQNDVKLHTASGTFQLSNPMDKLLLGILSEISAYDNTLRTERMRLGKLSRLRQGCWIGGVAPYGYKVVDRKLVVQAEEAKTVREIFREYCEGMSVKRIRKSLIEKGVRPRRGNKIWSLGSVEALLSNSHYRGSYTVTDKKYKETVEIQCEAILSPSLLQHYDAARQNRKTHRAGESNLRNFYLLRGLLFCGHCESVLGGRIYPTQRRSVYYCTRRERLRDDPYAKNLTKCTCGPYLRIKETDEFIWKTVVEVLEQSHHYKEKIKQLSLNAKKADGAEAIDSRSLQSQIRRTGREIQEIKRSVVSVESSRILQKRGSDVVDAILKNLDEHLQSIEARRLDLLSRLKNADKLKRWTNWMIDFGTRITELKTMEEEAKKEFLEGIVSKITVISAPDNRYTCTLFFRLPYVQDKLLKAKAIGAKKTAKGARFTVQDGKDTITAELHLPVMKRRRRQMS